MIPAAMRRDRDPREELDAAAAAVAGYDLPRARELLDALRASRPDDADVFDAWVALLVDHLGDDRGALDATPPGDPRASTRARLVTAGARAGRLDDARRWVDGLDPARHGEAWARWLDALLRAGALDEASRGAQAIRGRRALGGELSAALHRVDEALRPERERAREAERARRAERERGRVEAARARLDEGRWEAALAVLAEADEADEDAARELRDAQTRRALAQREDALREASAARVAAVERALGEGADRDALRALASLAPEERARVRESLVPQGFLSILGDPRTRESEAVDAALALREASRARDPAAVLALLRPHASALRRVPEGREALEAAESAHALASAHRVEAPDDPLRAARAEVESLAARGEPLAAWRRAEREGLLDEARAHARAAARRYAISWEPDASGPPEEAHAELLRADALVAHPVDADAAVSVSTEGRAVTWRRVDLRSGRVTARARAWLDDEFTARASRWDGSHLSLASERAVLSVDAREGTLRAYWRAPTAGLLAEAPRACGDPDFAWVTGRDARGQGAVAVIDLARGERVSRFAAATVIDVEGSAEALCHDPSGRLLQLRDAHGVVLASCAFEREGELLAACPSPEGRGVLATFRERHPQTAASRRRALPPTFSLAVVHLRVGSREAATLTLRSCARDDVAAVARARSEGSAWVRLGPADLPGELISLRASDLRVRSRRAVSAGVALRATGAGAMLASVSTRRCLWQPDPSRDPVGPGDDVPLAAHQPSFAWALPCAPRADDLAWAAHAPAVSALVEGRRGEFDDAVRALRRSPPGLLGMHRVLAECGRVDDAAALLRLARAAHPEHAGLRLEHAGRRWAAGDAAGVREALEGAELLGLGEDLAHARHLLGLARLVEGDEAGAAEAWREGRDAPLLRPACALSGALAVLAGRGGEGCLLADALSGASSAAMRAVLATAAGRPGGAPW
ncbi:MAG: hypothetical protein R3A48_17210 [Polyangiales bacterium]